VAVHIPFAGVIHTGFADRVVRRVAQILDDYAA
jgi:hypothetical protein